MRNFVPMLGMVMCAITAQAQSAMPKELRCNYLKNPLGLGDTAPRLSWQLQSKKRGVMQTAYQIIAASSEKNFRAGVGDLWNTGKVNSDRANQIAYKGKPLGSRQGVWWGVTAYDNNGGSAKSQPAYFEIGLLAKTDWKAQWIGLADNAAVEKGEGVQWLWDKDPNAAGLRYFRAHFDLPADRKIRSAQVMTLGDNLFQTFINGERVQVAGGWQTWNSADITKNIKVGKNTVAVIVNNTDGQGGMASLIKVIFDNGEILRVPTSKNWIMTATPPANWEKSEADESNWTASNVLGDLGMAPWNRPSIISDPSPAPFLRRAFITERRVKRARLYSTAKGVYKAYINGKLVSDDIFRPGWTDYKKRIQYQTYDVTRHIKKGDNALGIVLGDGWYCGHIAWAGRRNYGVVARAMAQLEIEYDDGSTQMLVTNPEWSVKTGAILSSDMLMGETYDARKELGDWANPGYDDRDWARPETEALGTVPIVAQVGPSVKQVVTLKPKSITEKNGAYLFDMGQNMVGWVRLKVNAKPGETVTLRHAEILNPDGTIYITNLRAAKATDIYIARSGGTETFEPSFTFHGFRYVEVTGVSEKPTLETVTGIVVSSMVSPSGSFVCSNPMLNQLQKNIEWGQRGNYLEVPTDCPQRDERLGWMGDAQVFIRTACFNDDVAALMNKWVQDVADAQGENGAFSDVSPRVAANSDAAPAWGDAGVIVPWTVYRCYGDTALLEKHYPNMARWVEYIRAANPDGLWINKRSNDYGDWLSIAADTPKEILATGYYAYSTRIVAQTARLLGKTEEADKYDKLFQEIKAAFNNAFVRPADGKILSGDGTKGDTQTCYLVGLRFDLLSDSARVQAAKHLVDDIVNKKNGHLSTGFVGVGYLNPTLTQTGNLDVAYRLLNNDTFPSWGYSIKQGATTIWERWDGWTKEKGFQDPGMNSFNHYSLGSVGEWMSNTVAGIDLDPQIPAYKHIVLRPMPGGGLTYAKATYDSIQGRIISDWKLENGGLTYRVEVPANTTATVYVPAKNGGIVMESGKAADKSEGVVFVKNEAGAAVYNVGSGSYTFTVK